MRTMYLLIVFIVAVSALGCVGNKEADNQVDTSSQAPVSSAQTLSGNTSDDLFGTESELTSVDSLVNDLNADIAFSDSI